MSLLELAPIPTLVLILTLVSVLPFLWQALAPAILYSILAVN